MNLFVTRNVDIGNVIVQILDRVTVMSFMSSISSTE